MLPKKHRVSVEELIRKKGRGIRGAHLTIKVFSAGTPYNRFNVVVSKKVAKSAVQRNKLRRLLFKAIEKEWKLWPRGEYLIIAHPGSLEAPKEKIYGECHPSRLS